MPLTGNVDALGNLARRIEDLSQVPTRASATVAEQISTSMEAEFNEGKDPYGAPWAPLSEATLRKGRSAPPLTDTGKMRASARATAAGNGVAVHIAPPAQFLQAKRPILPVPSAPPPAWDEIVEGAVKREIAAIRGRS